MSMDRRDFLRLAGVAGASVVWGSLAGAAPKRPDVRVRPGTGKTAVGLRAPKLDKVRLGFIGVGARGSGHVVHMTRIEGTEIVAICDNHLPSAEKSAKRVVDAGRPAPAMYTDGPYAWRKMLERNDIDAVIISTPWEWHAKMSVETMNAGKHAFIEVPAALTVEECWQLVDTSERTQRHCMMLENVCYNREELMVLNMCRLGVLGELLHAEAAYIHDLRWQMKEIEHGTGSWRTYEYAKRNGNLYPTHGLGPVAQYLGINRGDLMDYLSSVSCMARSRELYARANFPEGHERRSIKFVCGDINTTIVKTVRGRTIMIQWDEQLPRPYTRHNLIQGTKGIWSGFEPKFAVEGEGANAEEWIEGDKIEAVFQKYEHPLWKRMGEEAKRNGGHGGMDFLMLWRIIYCLRNGLPLDQDVYDAASWSVITPLTEWSVANRSQSIDIPDFTRGAWETTRPLGIVK
jgi:predicted dehydrogenase